MIRVYVAFFVWLGSVSFNESFSNFICFSAYNKRYLHEIERMAEIVLISRPINFIWLFFSLEKLDFVKSAWFSFRLLQNKRPPFIPYQIWSKVVLNVAGWTGGSFPIWICHSTENNQVENMYLSKAN